jgi:hypothetical protein
MCKLLATEGYDVVLLPVVLESAGTLSNALNEQQKKWTSPLPEKKKLHSKLHLHSIHSLQNLVSQRRYLKRQKPTSESRGRIRGR